jgi:hypothetical protein
MAFLLVAQGKDHSGNLTGGKNEEHQFSKDRKKIQFGKNGEENGGKATGWFLNRCRWYGFVPLKLAWFFAAVHKCQHQSRAVCPEAHDEPGSQTNSAHHRPGSAHSDAEGKQCAEGVL